MLLVGPSQFRKFNESMIVKMNLFSDRAQQVLCFAPHSSLLLPDPGCAAVLHGFVMGSMQLD